MSARDWDAEIRAAAAQYAGKRPCADGKPDEALAKMKAAAARRPCTTCGKTEADRPKVSVCINSHNEGPRLAATVRAFHENLGPWPHEFIVVADEVTDGCADSLDGLVDADTRVVVIRNSRRRGCGRCKCQAIEAASGNVLVFLDAHMNVLAGRVAAMAARAAREEAIFTPVIRDMRYSPEWTPHQKNTRNNIPSPRALKPGSNAQYRLKTDEWVMQHHGEAIEFVGVGFAVSRRTLERIGGLNAYRGLHGSQERGISLRAFMANVPIKLDGNVCLGHEFRKTRQKPKEFKRFTKRDQHLNLWHAYRVVLGDEAFAKLLPALRKHAPLGERVIDRVEIKMQRKAFNGVKRREDVELLRRIAPDEARPEPSPVSQEGARVLSDPKIDVRIAYEPGGKIGQDYNRIMRETAHEWVLFLDHDVLLLHPSWYEVCQEAIRSYPKAGLFTCYTNNIACKHQKDNDAPAGHDILEHRGRARELWDLHQFGATLNRKWLIAGFVMLTSKSAWEKAGGFPEDGFFGVDNEYDRRIRKAGLKTYRLDGLYCYHIRDREGENWIEGVDVSASLAKRRTPLEIKRSGGPARLPSKRCVYTVLTGGYDDGLPPHANASGWDFVAFVDDMTIPPNGWKLRKLDARGRDPKRASRLYKLLAHKHLPEYEYSLYIDANIRLWRDPSDMARQAGVPDVCSVKHPWRACVYDELTACMELDKAPAEALKAQKQRYRAEGVPRGLPLYENGCMLRRHNAPAVRELMEAWWAELERSETVRDQPALAIALWRAGATIESISATQRTRYLKIKRHPHQLTEAQ